MFSFSRIVCHGFLALFVMSVLIMRLFLFLFYELFLIFILNVLFFSLVFVRLMDFRVWFFPVPVFVLFYMFCSFSWSPRCDACVVGSG